MSKKELPALIEEQWAKINCFYPAYTASGANGTVLQFAGGTSLTKEHTCKAVLLALADHFAVNLARLRRACQDVTGHKNTQPLPLHPDLVLVPIEVRRPLGANQGRLGYAVLARIAGLTASHEEGYRGRIIFADDSHLDTLIGQRTLREREKEARLIWAHFREHIWATAETPAAFSGLAWLLTLLSASGCRDPRGLYLAGNRNFGQCQPAPCASGSHDQAPGQGLCPLAGPGDGAGQGLPPSPLCLACCLAPVKK